jgi:hypothetical protein
MYIEHLKRIKSISYTSSTGLREITSEVLASELGLSIEDFQEFLKASFVKDVKVFNCFTILALSQITIYIKFPKLEARLKTFFTLGNNLAFLSGEDTDVVYRSLERAVITEFASTLRGIDSEIISVHPWFEKNYSNLISGSKLIPVKAINRKRPDFLIELNSLIIPVECKKVFSVRSLSQLQGYMKLWKVNKGVAVANKYTCSLPSNIIALTVSKESEVS